MGIRLTQNPQSKHLQALELMTVLHVSKLVLELPRMSASLS